MTTLLFGALGSALGPVGAALGSLVGAYVDRTVINPLLNPKPNIEGPRAADFRLQQQEEGAVANWILGGESRVAGVFIYAEPVREVQIEEEVGGSGGGQTVISYRYYTTVAISFAIQRGVTVSQILAEGEVLYDANPNIVRAGSNIAATVTGTTRLRLKLTAPDGGPDLSAFRSGRELSASGFANGTNNGTWRVEQAGVETGGTFVVLENTGGTTEAAGASVTLTQVLPNFDPARVEDVEIYDGSQVTADPTIEAARGVGLVPAYAGSAYVVLKNLALAPYGNRVPLLNFRVGSSTGTTVRTAVEAICQRAGMTAGQIDASALSGTNRGYALSGPVSPVSVLQPLLLRHDVLTQEAEGKIRFFHRSQATIVFVPREEIAAAPGYSEERSTPWQISRGDLLQLPPRIFVGYIKAENGERGGEPFARNGEESARIENVFLPISMTASEARAVEKRLSYLARFTADTHRLTLGPKWLGLGENDVICTWWTPGELIFLQVLRVDVDPNFNVSVEAIPWHRPLSTQTADADDPSVQEPAIHVAAAVDSFVMETAPFGPVTPSDVIRPVVVVAVPDDNEPFAGATVMGSLDDDEYLPLASVSTEGKMGYARTVLADGVDPFVWDRTSTVDVEVWHGTLESRDEIDVLKGANLALIGNEIVAFSTATLIAPRLYRLSVLLRGRRDTVDTMTGHAADEPFVMLSAPGVKLVDVALTAMGSVRYFKVVPNGVAIADVDAASLTLGGRNLRPFAPTALIGTRDDAGNLALSWNRRTRVMVADLPVGPVPLGEQDERYEVELWWGSALKRTVSTTTTATTYTEAQQTADGVDLFTAVEVRVYQLSGAYGRGRALIGSV